ncbi:MAG: chromate transporter [Chitinispirillia bacterium]|nr:chromate transporter [Chitinispirillia bacterium]MCL2269229.1 chromate transporter [Chitinispirillia bacterium]
MILLELLKSFFIIGAFAFGGGYSTITMIEHEVVTIHGWITSAELSELIAVAQMTPGPIGVNAATYAGFRVAGLGGAAVATAAFTLPSIIFCSALIRLLARAGSVPWVETLRKSVQPAVAGLIIAAVLAYGRSAIPDAKAVVLAVLTFTVLTVWRDKVHPVLLILCGGAAGIFI